MTVEQAPPPPGLVYILGWWREVSTAPLMSAVVLTARPRAQTGVAHIADDAGNVMYGVGVSAATDPEGRALLTLVWVEGAVYDVEFGGVKGTLRCDDWDEGSTVPFTGIRGLPGGDGIADPLTWDAVISGLNGRIAAQVAPVVEDYFTAPPPLDMVIDGAVEDYLTAHPVTAEAISGGVDLDNAPLDRVAYTAGAGGGAWADLHYPANVAGVVPTYRLVNGSDSHAVQTFTSREPTPRMWTRGKTSGTWGAWTLVGPSSASAGTITGTTDLDTLPVGSTMGTAGPAASPGWVALHYPVLAVGSITTTGLTDNAAHVVQTFTTDTGTMYVRRRTSGTWGAWTQVGKSALPASYGAIDLNTLTRGTRQAHSGAFTNGPAGMAAGMVETTAIQDSDTYLLQVATEWTYADVPGRIWTRRKSNTTWGAWTLVGPVDTSLYPKLPAVRTASGFKAPRCPITLGHNTSGSAPVTNGAVRLPIRWGAKPTRIRPIIADVDIRAGIRSTTADIVITGVWVAAYDESTGAVSNLTQISAGGTIPAGGDWVGTWAPFPAAITGDAWCLIYGYTGTPSCQNRGFAQQHTDPAQAGTTSTGWTTTMNAPFAVSLDVEVPNGTPVVMYVGDSLLCGQGATKGTFEGIANVHARSIKAIPVLACSAGDTVQGMTTFTAYKWSRFAGMASPDAVLLEAGVNDIGNGTTADALQGYTATLVTWLAQQYGPVHLSTITPREGATASQKAERAAYNTWLRSAPLGVRDVHDVTLTMQQPGDPDLLVDAYDAGDGLHFTTAGHAAYAAAISRPLTSPPVAYQAVV